MYLRLNRGLFFLEFNPHLRFDAKYECVGYFQGRSLWKEKKIIPLFAQMQMHVRYLSFKDKINFSLTMFQFIGNKPVTKPLMQNGVFM